MTSSIEKLHQHEKLKAYQTNMEKLIFVLNELNDNIQLSGSAKNAEAAKLYLYHARQHQETAAKLATTLIPATL